MADLPEPVVRPRGLVVMCSACGFAIDEPVSIAGWTWEDCESVVRAGRIVCTNRRCGQVHSVPEAVRRFAEE